MYLAHLALLELPRAPGDEPTEPALRVPPVRVRVAGRQAHERPRERVELLLLLLVLLLVLLVLLLLVLLLLVLVL